VEADFVDHAEQDVAAPWLDTAGSHSMGAPGGIRRVTQLVFSLSIGRVAEGPSPAAMTALMPIVLQSVVSTTL
jgi:hypothetical protein